VLSSAAAGADDYYIGHLNKIYDCDSDFVINIDCRVRTGYNSIWLGSP